MNIWKYLFGRKPRPALRTQAARCVKCDTLYILDSYMERRNWFVCQLCKDEAEKTMTEIRGIIADNDLEK